MTVFQREIGGRGGLMKLVLVVGPEFFTPHKLRGTWWLAENRLLTLAGSVIPICANIFYENKDETLSALTKIDSRVGVMRVAFDSYSIYIQGEHSRCLFLLSF